MSRDPINSADSTAIAVIEDQGGFLVLGDSTEIEPWLSEQGLASKEFVVRAAGAAGQGLQLASEAATQSGRWVKLTKESSELLSKYGKLGKQSGVLRSSNGQIVKHLEFFNPGELLNPSMAAGVGGAMAQYALDQAIEEITDYLKTIDSKLDDVLQDQKDHTLGELRAAALAIEQARATRDEEGYTSLTTWSKVQSLDGKLMDAQQYALAKIESLAKKLEGEKDAARLLDVTTGLSKDVNYWLGMLAWAIREQDELAVIELDRVLVESPETVEGHKRGLSKARKARLERVEWQANALEARLAAASKRISGNTLHLVAELPILPRESDRALGELAAANDELARFSRALEVHLTTHRIAEAPEWQEAVGQVVGDVASDVRGLAGAGVKGSQEVATVVADTAKSLGGGVAEAGVAFAGQAQKALEGLQLPKLPFGGRR